MLLEEFSRSYTIWLSPVGTQERSCGPATPYSVTAGLVSEGEPVHPGCLKSLLGLRGTLALSFSRPASLPRTRLCKAKAGHFTQSGVLPIAS